MLDVLREPKHVGCRFERLLDNAFVDNTCPVGWQQATLENRGRTHRQAVDLANLRTFGVDQLYPANDLLTETLLQAGQELRIIQPHDVITLIGSHGPHQCTTLPAHGQQCHRPGIGKALVGDIPVITFAADVGNHSCLAIIPPLAVDTELIAEICLENEQDVELFEPPVSE